MMKHRSLASPRRLLIPIVGVVAIVGVAACQPNKQPPPPPPCTQAPSSTVGPISFEAPTYTPGSINGQDGWVATGGFDQAVVMNGPLAPGIFGSQSWRVSNAVTSGSFGDQPFSKPLGDEAGEATAENAGLSGGTRRPCFNAAFLVAPSTGTVQPGLRVTVSPDRGDGARMSFVALEHTATDLVIKFIDVQGVDPPSTPTPCFQCANFVTTNLGSFDPSVPHAIGIQMHLAAGNSNDVVKVFVDGDLKHVGGSWEDYYRLDTESNQPPNDTFKSRTIDSLLFRMSSTAQPLLSGQGFLVEGLSLASGN